MQRMRRVQLGDLLHGIEGISVRFDDADSSGVDDHPVLEVVGLTEDSRAVAPGFIFVARVGEQFDGRQFIGDAVARGAVAVMLETTSEGSTIPKNAAGTSIPLIEVVKLSAVLGIIAERFYDRPTTGPESLKLIGITGTNGKTTTAHLIHTMLNQAGKKCGLIGTVSIDDGGPAGLVDSELTTPMAIELSATLAQMVANKCEYAVMEVSSHALAQGRANGLQFSGAVFTNLSGDHLDFHGTMARYAEAKATLFTLVKQGGWAVINLDDDAGTPMAEAARRAGLTVVGVGQAAKSPVNRTAIEKIEGQPAWEVEVLEVSLGGMKLALNSNAGKREVRTKLVGNHNALNLLEACAVVNCCEVDISKIYANLATTCPAPPGRLEPVSLADGTDLGFAVLVDYAHTDDALQNVLCAVRPMVQIKTNDTGVDEGRLIVVFGCGGDRDRTKRPRMLQAACATSDIVMVTSDNPRTESANEIIGDILGEMSTAERLALEKSGQLLVEVDRAKAIKQVLSSSVARPGDVIVIAGKGHEGYQIIGRVKHDFDDRVIARNVLTQRKTFESFWTITGLAEALDGEFVCNDRDVQGSKKLSGEVSIDSRAVQPNAVFIAIKGDRFDGHDYVQGILKAGQAALIIVSAAWWKEAPAIIFSVELATAAFIIVENTITALGQLAAAYRQECLANVKIVAITGSCGKTTTKCMIDAVLRQTLAGGANIKSFNNNIGVPLTILQADPHDDYLIVEIGTNAPGEIQTLGEIARADFAVITNVGRSHLAGLGSVAGVAREKITLFNTLTKSNPRAMWPADGFDLQPLLDENLDGVSFGESPTATVRLISHSISEAGDAMNFTLSDDTTWSVPALGKHQVLNAIVALTIGRQMGLSDTIIQIGLTDFRLPTMRFERTLISDRNIVIFNDAYNANPESMRVSIETFINLTNRAPRPLPPGQRILVLGEMLELGEAGSACHQELVQWVMSLLAEKSLDRVFLVGAGFTSLAESPQVNTVAESNLSSLARIADEIQEGAVVLLKGSRGVGLERLLTILKEGELSTP